MNEYEQKDKIKPLGFIEAHDIVQSNKDRINPWDYWGKTAGLAAIIYLIIGPIFIYGSMYSVSKIASFFSSKLVAGIGFALALMIWLGIGMGIYYLMNVKLIRDNDLLEPVPVTVPDKL